jgi:hypothetical protein
MRREVFCNASEHSQRLEVYATMNNEQRSYKPTVEAPAPLPLSHLTMTDRFWLYDRACRGLGYLGVWPAQLTEWALAVGLIGAPKTPVIEG